MDQLQHVLLFPISNNKHLLPPVYKNTEKNALLCPGLIIYLHHKYFQTKLQENYLPMYVSHMVIGLSVLYP